MKQTDLLLKNAQDVWDAYLQHPFLQELGEGTLNKKKFEHYLIQDYLYLKDYAKVFCLGVIKSSDIEHMKMFYHGAGASMAETGIHLTYLEDFGHSIEDLEKQQVELTTESYTSYMLGIAVKGNIKEIVAGLLPCIWSYCYIGQHLRAYYQLDERHFYRNWIEAYSDQAFIDVCNSWIDFSNRLFEDATVQELERLSDIFRKASIYELQFWNMAYEEVE